MKKTQHTSARLLFNYDRDHGWSIDRERGEERSKSPIANQCDSTGRRNKYENGCSTKLVGKVNP